MIILDDKKYRYRAIFDSDTGRGLRTNVYDENGDDTGVDPYMGSFPELLDIGIMGHCAHGKSGLCLKSGVECYQDGAGLYEENMPLHKYKKIIDECHGRTFQVALGGRGDPDMHEHFAEILKYTRTNNVVPNFTTSGFGLKESLIPIIREYCGAVAVSWYRNEYTARALEMFLSAEIRTNIHYCLSNSTINEAIEMIEHKAYPEKINRIIFLLHKPVGLGSRQNVLSISDERVKYFFSLFNKPETVDKAGFDSCSVPALLSFAGKLHPMCIEACEAGRFSAYVSPDSRLFPCSFEKDPYYGVDLEKSSLEQAWNSEPFERFRTLNKEKCPGCPKYELCFGGCPIIPGITLCNGEFRNF